MSTLTSMFSSAPYARLSARAMMSPTTSLGRPFSAESCARPVTSSRFMRSSPFFYSGDKKSGGRPTFLRRPRPTATYRRPGEIVPNLWQFSGEEAAGPPLGQVVPDVGEEVPDLVGKEDRDDDHGERDDGDDECVLDHSLCLLFQ